MNNWGTKEWFESQFSSHELDTLGDKWGHRWRGSQKLRYKLSLSVIKNIVKNSRSLKILDIGCALGDFTSKVYHLNPRNEFYGIDISQKAIDYVSKKYKWLHAKPSALPDIPFPSNSFDLVIALEVLYYLEEKDRRNALHEIKRVLKNGGYLLVSGPLDGGKRYFSKDVVLQLLSKFFIIEHVTFNYAKVYTYVEKRTLGLYSRLVAMEDIFAMGNEEFLSYLSKKPKTRANFLYVLRGIFALPLLGWSFRLLLKSIVRLLKAFLSSRSIPTFFYLINRHLAKEKGKSHVIILCRKER